MKKSARLAPLLKLEQNREQEKVRMLGEARSRVTLEQQKLKQLVEYRAEYERLVTQEGSQGIPASRLQGYHQFLNRLTAAINQQEQQLAQVRQQETVAQQNWLQQRGAVKRMDTLVDRSVQQERRDEEKREQKMLDEQAQLAFLQRRSGGFQ